MNKKVFTICALVLALLTCACAAGAEYSGADFEAEYELLNGQYDLEGTHIYSTIDVPADANIVYADLAKALEVLDSGTGIIYFGFPECPWCRTLVPVLFESIESAGYEGDIYYVNCLADRDSRYLDESGEIVTESEGTPEYTALLEKMGDKLGVYEGLGDESLKRLYFPTTVFVSGGQITDIHLVTVDSQESGYDALSEEQHAELLDALKVGVMSIME